MATKRQAAGAFMGNLMALVSYKLFLVEEKKTSLGQVAPKDQYKTI